MIEKIFSRTLPSASTRQRPAIASNADTPKSGAGLSNDSVSNMQCSLTLEAYSPQSHNPALSAMFKQDPDGLKWFVHDTPESQIDHLTQSSKKSQHEVMHQVILAENKPIGILSLENAEKHDFWLLPPPPEKWPKKEAIIYLKLDARRSGFAHTASMLALVKAFNLFKSLKEIEVTVAKSNIPSTKLVKKIGFKKGWFRHGLNSNDQVVYVLKRNQLGELKKYLAERSIPIDDSV
jgi:RimJ/RimL family protein N-acetyltransferase